MTVQASNVRSTIPRENNMDFLRLLFAGLVVFAHGYQLSMAADLQWFMSFARSELAVRGFFVLSGFLIYMSYDRSRSLKDYLVKRARRILPAYVTVILACAILGVFVTTLPLNEYLGLELVQYLLSNLTFLNFLKPDLPGVYQDNVLHAVNGALWTIKVEVAFYLCVPVLAWFIVRFRPWWVIAGVYVLSVAYSEVFGYLHHTTGREIFETLADQLPGQMSYFVSGVAVYLYFDKLMANRLPAVMIGLVLFGLGFFFSVDAAYPAGLAILVVSFAFGPGVGNWARFGDFSYGAYIWHFPVIQLLISLGLFAANPYQAMTIAIGTTLILAVGSWHLVEKRWLSRQSHYRVATA